MHDDKPFTVRPIYSVFVTSTDKQGKKRVCVARTMDREEAYQLASQYGHRGSVESK